MYEKGVITKKETGGLELTWGNFAAIKELMTQIALRKGFGATMVNGVEGACKILGIKGNYPPDMINPRMMGGGISVPRTRAESILGALTYDRSRFPREYFDTVGKEGIRRYARDAGVDEATITEILSVKDYDIALFAKNMIPFNMFVQSFGTCDSHYFVHKAITVPRFVEAYKTATGIEIDAAGLNKAGYRSWYLQRAFNIREGQTRAEDVSRVSRNRSESEQLLDRFYEIEGWDKTTGKPGRQKLKELDIEYIADDLEV
jgi:aldehyde:ferredoxin oxidoreductase